MEGKKTKCKSLIMVYKKIAERIIFLFLIFLVGCGIFNKERFDLEKIIKSRPSKKGYVFDYAHLLKYTKENMEEHLKYFKEKYGIEMLIVTIPSLKGKSISEVASRMFTSWNIGRDNQGKGILLLLSDKEKLIKVEVGYGAEGVFTDLFCGYIERKQLKPYFKNNQVDEGLSAAREEFIGRAEGRLTDEEIRRKMKGYLSAGAGIKRKVEIGEFSQREELSEEEKEYFSAQSTPEELLKRWMEEIKKCISDPALEMYTEESRVLMRGIPKSSKALCRDLYRRYSRPYEIKVKGDYAVILYPGSRKEGPMFMKRTDKGWQVDILSMGKWVRYNQNNDWFIGGDSHPYMFAFENNQYSKYVWDYDYYDDFGKFSPVRSNYDYYINLYKERLNENPDDFEAIISLGEIFFDLCVAKEAIPLFKKAIKLNPKDARAYRYLGLINRDCFCSPKTALEYLKKYTELAPSDADGYFYVAICYTRMGKFDKAVEYMKKYTRVSGKKIYGYNRIGYLYDWKGDYQKAKRWFKKVLELDPTNKYATDMLRTIEEENK